MNFTSAFIAMSRDLPLSHFLSGVERKSYFILCGQNSLAGITSANSRNGLNFTKINTELSEKLTSKCLLIILFPDNRQPQSKSKMYG